MNATLGKLGESLGLVNLKLSKALPVYQATAGHNDLTTNTLTLRKLGKLGVRDANCDPRKKRRYS